MRRLLLAIGAALAAGSASAVAPLVGPQQLVDSGAPITSSQRLPAVAYGPGELLVAWSDDRSGAGWEAWGRSVQRDATPKGSSLVLAWGTSYVRSASPARPGAALTSLNGGTYAVVFPSISATTTSAHGMFMSPGSTPYLDWQPTTATSASQPDVAFGAYCLLVPFVVGTGTSAEIHSQAMSLTAFRLDERTLATGEVRAPRVASAGGKYLVVWERRTTAGAGDVEGALVTAADLSGTWTTPVPLAAAVASGATDQTNPAVAAASSTSVTGFLIAWEEGGALAARRYGVDGSPAGAAFGIPTRGGARAPAASFDGARFLVVWSDAAAAGTGRAVRATTVAPDGTVGDVFSVSEGPAVDAPAVASDYFGRSLVAYESDGGATPRVASRAVLALADGQACTASAECAGGSCNVGTCGAAAAGGSTGTGGGTGADGGTGALAPATGGGCGQGTGGLAPGLAAVLAAALSRRARRR